jgi:RNA polymerase sigma-70 factor (ECF subfamily)
MVQPTGKPPGKEQEGVLIGRAQHGDRDAVRELIELHKDRLFAFIWRMTHNHHDTEEICQEAFLKAFAALGTFSVEYRFSTWLFTIGYRICLNRMRRRPMFADYSGWDGIEAGCTDAGEGAIESEEARRLRGTVWTAVSKLSAPQRAAVLLFYRHEMGCPEIARVLELPVATVKSHLHRARQRLREIMETADEQGVEQFRNRSRRAV